MTELARLVEVNPPSRLPSAAGPARLVTMADIDAGSATLGPRSGEVPALHPEENFRTARAGDVLLARISPSMENGKVAVIPGSERLPCLVSRELLVLRPRPGVDPRLIWAFFRRDSVRAWLAQTMTGSTARRRLQRETVERIGIPEPSEGAQQAAFTALEHLDRARILRHRVNELAGGLPAALVNRVAGAQRGLRLEDLPVRISHGSRSKISLRGRQPVLRATNIVDGLIDLRDLRFAAEVDQREADLLVPGDLLLVGSSGNRERFGDVGVYEGAPAAATHAAFLIRLRLRDGAQPDFLWAWLRSARARSFLLSRSSDKSGRLTLSLKVLNQLPVPLISTREETRVAALARLTRNFLRLGREQRALLDQSVQAHLDAFFSGAAAAPELAPLPEPTPAAAPEPADFPLPALLAAASSRQRRVWEEAVRFEESFGIADLDLPETARAELQHSLAILEQVGVLIRDQEGALHRWRRPDPELELFA